MRRWVVGLGRTPLTEHGSLLRIGGIVDRDMRAIANEIETRQVADDHARMQLEGL